MVDVASDDLNWIWVRPVYARAKVRGGGDNLHAASSRAADEFQVERQAPPSTAARIARGLGRSAADGSARADTALLTASRDAPELEPSTASERT